MAISRWEPVRDVLSVRDAVNRLFDQSIWAPMAWGANGYGLQAPMDVYTDGDTYVVELALPGLDPDSFDIQMVGNTLTIGAEVKLEAPEGRGYLLRQRQGGKFQTSFTFPDAADASQIQATYERGVLRLTVPKSEAARPRRIEVKAS